MLVHIRKDATFFRSDSDGDGLMSKIQNDRLFKPYPHGQSSTCQNNIRKSDSDNNYVMHD